MNPCTWSNWPIMSVWPSEKYASRTGAVPNLFSPSTPDKKLYAFCPRSVRTTKSQSERVISVGLSTRLLLFTCLLRRGSSSRIPLGFYLLSEFRLSHTLLASSGFSRSGWRTFSLWSQRFNSSFQKSILKGSFISSIFLLAPCCLPAYAARSSKSITKGFITATILPLVPPTQLMKVAVAANMSLINWSSVCLSETPKRWAASLRTGSWFCKVLILLLLWPSFYILLGGWSCYSQLLLFLVSTDFRFIFRCLPA